MKRPVAEQVIVVSGASSGIGRAVARAAGGRGASVVVSARNAEGWQAGVRAADRAQLGHERPVPGTSPPCLTL